MKSLFFTEEHELFRSTLQDFFKAEVSPYINEWESVGKVDRSIFKKMGEMGFLGLEVEEKYGGMGLDFLYTTILCEELGRTGSSGFATTISAHSYLAMNYLVHAGTSFIKEKYLVPSVAGEKVGSLSMTEPFAGSDLRAIRTTARLEGDHYIVDGSKTFISNGYYGDYTVAAVKTESGISMMVIDLDSDGITKSKLDKVGIRCSDTAELAFNNVKVPKENLLGEEGKGFYYMMESLQVERLTLAQSNMGFMEHALDITLQYISERMAFGKSINKFQVLRHRIADMASDIEAWKAFCNLTSYRLAQGEHVVKECSMLKLKTSDLANSIVYECLQMFGGYGFMEEYPIGRMYRDIRIAPIYGGTSEIMKEIIAKMIIDKKSYKPAYKA
ncbi:MAG: acyl-CoA dehydrogenase family protein [Saprospiraceae bacterium]